MKLKSKTLKQQITGYSFILPSLILLSVFVIAPILLTFYYSMTDYNGFQAPAWAGFKNFKEAFSDLSVQAALKNTFVFTVISVPVEISVSLLCAALIAARYRNKFGEFVRGVMFIPVLCSSALIGTIFAYLFAANQDAFFNMLLQTFGIEKVNWLGSEKTALGVIIFVNAWKDIGYYMVIIYAGIMDIPNDLYEASAIDGATRWQQFLKITIPNLRSVLFMIITVCTIWSFQLFDLAYSMTAGGPGHATTSLVYQVYLQGFRSFKFGYASAIAVILFVLVLVINIIQKLFMKETD